MALPRWPTAAQLAEFLQRNDPRHSQLDVFASAYESAANSWTARERREVVAAAKHNTSVRHLEIDVDELTSNSAKLIASIVSQLDHVRKLRVVDSREVEDRPPTSAVDAVLAGIFRSGSSITSLNISSSFSASAVLKVTAKYPDIEELVFSEEFWDDEDDDEDVVGNDRDALAMAVAVSMGQLSSLRRVGLLFSSTYARVFGILSAVHTAPTVTTLEVGLPAENDADQVVMQAAFVCGCTRTIETVIFRGEENDPDQRLVEVSPLFGAVPSFAPSIKEVQFHGCQLLDPDDAIVKRAAQSMEHVESLSFFLSPCPFGLQLLERMPRLRMFSLVTRGDEPWEYEDNYDDYSFLIDNDDVAALCRVINRKRSLLEDLEIELEGSEDEPLPAITTLLRSCRGRLVVKLTHLPSESFAHIVRGIERLRPDLTELRVRFRFCQLVDQQSADILFALQTNRTLRTFEYDVAFGANAETIFAIRQLVETNDALETLSLRELNADKCAPLLEEVLPDLADDWAHHAGPVLEMLQENHVLSGLEGFDLTEDNPVALLLKQNRYGRRFLHVNDRSPIGIWAPVLANISHNEEHGVMYKFLRAKPDLVVRTARPVSARGRGRGRKRGRGV